MKILTPDDEMLVIHINLREHSYSVTQETENLATIRITPLPDEPKQEELDANSKL